MLFCVMFIALFFFIIHYKVDVHGNEDHAPPKTELKTCKLTQTKDKV